MIIFTDRAFNTLAIADTETPDGLKILEDSMNMQIASGTTVYTCTLAKNDPSVAEIKAGGFVFVPDFKRRKKAFEIMEVHEDSNSKEISAEDAGLDLLNGESGPIDMKGTLAEFVAKIIGDDSGWELGHSEVDPKRSLTLKWEGVATQTKRLVMLAGRFGAEVSYSFEYKGDHIEKKMIDFHLKRGKEVGVRLEVGKELKDVKRTVSIEKLATAILPIGEPHKEKIKTEKTVMVNKPKPQPQPSNRPEDNPILNKFVGWMKERRGKVCYSMDYRTGPHSYDCSSAVYFAALHAGLIDRQGWPATTETLFAWKGKYLDEISRNEATYGDIFVHGVQGRSMYAGGHTGIILNKNQIIHCTTGWGGNGIMITNWSGMGGSPVRFFRWKRAKNAHATSRSGGGQAKYWTSGNLVDHDLGWKLPGLTAQQLNNWVRATSPGSPFNGQGQVFLDAQAKSGLDARYLLAHAALESAWGTSNYGRNHHNYFGIGAFDNNPDNAKNYSNPGLATGIIEGAKWIAKNYYNGQWKQRTLRKMRWNNNVHQYATAPNWDTAIARIMKGSERFTRPGSTGQGGGTTTQTIVEETETEKPTNLIGYKYDDGRYFVDEKGRLIDRVAAKQWARFGAQKGGYIVKIYSSQATSQKTLLDEAKNQLEKIAQPEVHYEVNLAYLPDSVDIGDTVRLIDHEYTPELFLDARLVEVTYSRTHKSGNRVIFSNFREHANDIDARLIKLRDMLLSEKARWDNMPYSMQIASSSGNLLKEGVTELDLVAQVYRQGVDVTATLDGFLWQRVTDYKAIESTTDEAWNKAHEDANEAYLHVTPEDLEIEATFTCSAMVNGTAVAVASYTVKNLAVKVFKGDTKPTAGMKYGDIFVKTDGSRFIYTKNDSGALDWIPQVTKRDLEAIEKMPGPAGAPGKDGKDGLPGKDGRDGKPGADGKNAYIHFAYAESADGRTGFTLTATSGKKYIGVLADDKQTDSTDPSAYEWSLFKGADGERGKDGKDGLPGKAGADGRTPYIHTAWADSVDGRTGFSVDQSQGKTYMGTCVDYTQADPTDPTKYNWVRCKGEPGGQGPKGDPADPEMLNKLSAQQQATEARLQLYPDPEELKKTTLELAKQQGYMNAIKVALESKTLSLLDRLAILEANVGKGKLSLQAIETYLNFGEEGVIIGKGDNPIKMVLANDRLEILDGKRVALTISNNSVSVPNLAVSGAFEFGNHLAVKQGKDHTIIKPRGVS